MSTKAARAIAPLNDSVRKALELCEEFDASAEYSARARAQEEVKGILFRRIPEDPSYPAFVNRNSEFYATYLGLKDIVKRNDVTLLEERFQKLRRGSQPHPMPPLQTVPQSQAGGSEADLPRKPVGSSSSTAASSDSAPGNPPYPLSPTSGDSPRPLDKLKMPEPVSRPRPVPEAVGSNRPGSASLASLASRSSASRSSDSLSSGPRRASPPAGTYEVSPAIVQNKIAVSKVLAIDVRPHEEFEAGHVECPLITCLEPVSLRIGMTERDLEDALVISSAAEFDSFAMRDEVDMIVLYDESSKTASETPAISTVYDTLVEAGRTPYILRGGYKAWRTALEAKGKHPQLKHVSRGSGSGVSHTGSQNSGLPSNGLPRPKPLEMPQPSYKLPPRSSVPKLQHHLHQPSLSPPTVHSLSQSPEREMQLPRIPQSPPSPPKHETLPLRNGVRSAGNVAHQPSPPLPPKEALPHTMSMPTVPEPLQPAAVGARRAASPPPPSQAPPVPPPHLYRQSSLKLSKSTQANEPTRPAPPSRALSGYADMPAKTTLPSLRVPKIFNPPQKSTSLSPSNSPSKFQDTRSTPPADSSSYMGYQNGRTGTFTSSVLGNGSAGGVRNGVLHRNGNGTVSQGSAYDNSLAYGEDIKLRVEPQVPAHLISTTGLANLGNTCYMNCIIQCLVGVPQLIEPFSDGTFSQYINFKSRLGYKGRFAIVFAHLVRAMVEHRGGYVAPHEIKKFAGELRPDSFAGYEQQDCQEFLTFVLDGLHEDLNLNGDKPKEGELDPQAEEHREAMGIRVASAIEWERYLKGDTSLIVDLFQGQYLSRLQCMTCKQTSTTYNAFSSLSLPIVSPKLLGQQTSLKACFDEFVKPELLDGDNAWFCPRCKKKRRTVKTLQISRLPPVLVIHLKRFKRSSVTGVNKLETPVDYPLRDLDLTRYWPQLRQSEFNAKEAEMLQQIPSRGQNPPFIYDLHAVTLHHGSLKGGHYTAVVRKPGHGWLYYDDSSVYPVKEKAAVSKQAYVLIYQRQM